MQEGLVRIKELVALARREGCRITRRTISTWVAQGLILPPQRISMGKRGNSGYYPISMLVTLRQLYRIWGLPIAERKKHLTAPTLEVIEVPEHSPLEVIERKVIEDIDGKIKTIKFFRYGGFAITVQKEKEVEE